MSNERNTESTAAPTAKPGPGLLEERTLSGIFVHFLGLITWIVLPGVIYLVSDHEFTRANARNALNWQLFYFASFVTLVVAIGIAALIDSTLSGILVFDLLLFGLVLGLSAGVSVFGIVFVSSVIFSLVATAKAIFGTAWTYPVAPDFVARIQSRRETDTAWWAVVTIYALTTPAAFVYVLWMAIGGGSEIDGIVLTAVLFLFFALFASIFTLVALYRDAKGLEKANAAWQPNWLPYVGVPFAGGALVYLLAAFRYQSGNPPGDGVYGFMVALWVVSVVYLFKRRKRIDAS